MIVAALAVLIGSIIIPNAIRSSDFLRLRFAVEEIANEIRLAQNLAQVQGRNVRAVFYADRLRVSYYSDSSILVRPELKYPIGIQREAAGDPLLNFTSLGGVSGPGENAAWSLCFTCGSERLFIVVAVNSGRVSIRDRLD